MAYNFSDYAQSGIFNHCFRTASFTKPSTIAIALCSNVPTGQQTGATIPELANANGYARYVNASGDISWNHHTAGSGVNLPTFTFNQFTGNIGWVSGVAFVDSATIGAGNVIMFGPLTTPREILANDYFQFNPGQAQLGVG